jgi:4-carboxymuconolactone decarboxylase
MARVPPITSKGQVLIQHHAIVDAIVGSRGSLEGPFSVFLHSPEISERVAHLGALVRYEGTLDFRVRTIAAMTVAREFEAMYVWGAQTGAARQRNVPETTITAIKENRSDGIPADDLAVVTFTRQLLRVHRVEDGLAQAMLARFGNDQYIQLTGAIGYYSMLCMTVNACELEPGKGAEVLTI